MGERKREEDLPRLERASQRSIGEELRKRLPLERTPPSLFTEVIDKLKQASRKRPT